jgi:NAD(P)H dehydrogenase (quinone)
MTTIAITGASGQLGRRTAELVLAAIEPEELILVTRDVDALDDFAERGATVRFGDFDDPVQLESAFAAADRLLLISTDALGRRVRQHAGAIDAALLAGVQKIVYTSIVNPSDSNPAAVAEEHRTTEELIRASELEWTFLRHGIYAEMLVGPATMALGGGRLVTNEGEGRTSYVSRDDCAAAAAAVLTSDSIDHDYSAYDITGPQALAAADLAALYAELGGRDVETVLVDDEAFVADLVEQSGVDEDTARAYASFGIATRRWFLAPVSTAVADLTGHEPRSVRDVLAARRGELAGVGQAG